MRLTRVHVEEPLVAGQPCVIEGTGANHIMRVLRLRDGDLLTLFDGRGGEYGARITAFRRNAVQVDVQEHRAVERESTLDLTLAQGISRGERMDWVIQKATELGVRRIIPVLTERSVVRLDERQSERKLQHWRAIVISACEQCGRNTLPELAEPMELYGTFKTVEPDFVRVLLSPSGTLRAGDLGQPTKIAVLIGPEGGLAEREQEAAVSAGFKEVQLGARILRTETAAIAALAALQHRFGDL
ncbi:MAG: 16S rRNA (uracil(1498)-N(3))-methyltransferase [Gammaproteobacteria bacterium]